MHDSVRLRPLTDEDAGAVLALNEANVVKLAPMDADRLVLLCGWADRADAIEVDGAFAGFVLTFRPDTAYDSENYRWFGERYGTGFYYLDRIVLAPQVRRRGVGALVYDELEGVARAHGRMALEVNLLPPNPASLAFHQGRGYAEVGRLGDDEHLVTLLTKTL